MTDSSPYSLIYGILLTVQIIIALVIGGLILIQRSEGGALGIGGGGNSAFMSARGAGNFLTRATGILAALLFINSVALFSIGNLAHRETSAVDAVGAENIQQSQQPVQPNAPAPTAQQSAPASSAAGLGLGDLPLSVAPAAPSSSAAPVTRPTTNAPAAASPAASVAASSAGQ